jgi:Holliday junction resolvasome RuvABC endonuclease subunit
MTSKVIENKKEQLVLALYPNAIGFGYAVMTNALDVLVSQVVNIRPISNKHTLRRIKEIINYYQPQIVIIEDYRGIGSRKSKRIKRVIDMICTYANQQHLKICKYSRSNIRYVFSNFNAHTKHEIACVIAGNVKNMERKLREPRKINESEKYVAGAFDAVSLGVTHFYLNN